MANLPASKRRHPPPSLAAVRSETQPSCRHLPRVVQRATRNRPPDPAADFCFRHRRRPFATCALATTGWPRDVGSRPASCASSESRDWRRARRWRRTDRHLPSCSRGHLPIPATRGFLCPKAAVFEPDRGRPLLLLVARRICLARAAGRRRCWSIESSGPGSLLVAAGATLSGLTVVLVRLGLRKGFLPPPTRHSSGLKRAPHSHNAFARLAGDTNALNASPHPPGPDLCATASARRRIMGHTSRS